MVDSGVASVAGLDTGEALAWIRRLHAHTGGYVSVSAINPDRHREPVSIAVDLTGDADRLIAAFLETHDERGAVGLYVRQTSLRQRPANGRGTIGDSLTLPALWIDGDTASPAHKHQTCPGGDACAHERKHRRPQLPLPPDADAVWAIVAEAGLWTPTVTQTTGNGVYGHWLLDVPRTVTEPHKGGVEAQLSARLHEQLKHAAARLGWHYGPLGDLPRVLRLPGTLNRKPGTPGGSAPSALTGDGCGRTYTWDEMASMVEAAETRTAGHQLVAVPAVQPLSRGLGPSQAAGGTSGVPTALPRLVQDVSPIDDFNRRADWLTDILEPAGWTLHSRPDGQTWVTRPGKDPAHGQSATINGTGADTMHVFSSDAYPFEADENYTKAGAWRELHHGGADGDPTWSATHRDLRARGYGDPLPDRRPALPDGPPGDDPWAGQLHDPGEQWADGPPAGQSGEGAAPNILPTLPVEFWTQRPYLTHIREAAHSRGASADVVLHATLARLSGMLPHWARADTGLGGLAPMNYFAAIVSDSGVGKSSDFDVARMLLQRPPFDFVDEAPLGSGEGVAELFMGDIEVAEESDGAVVPVGQSGPPDPPRRGRPKKPDTVRGQVRHNAFITADEGTAMTELMHGRKGSTLGSTLRTAWSGGTLGNANASKDRYRVIPAGSYSIGLCVGFQRATVAPLLEDHVAGTPQRFAFVAAVDPTIPRTRPRGVRPGVEVIRWDPGLFGRSEASGRGFDVAESIKDRLWEQHTAKKAGELVVETYDSHRPLFLVKVAGLLAVLDRRTDITEEDWSVAEQVWAGSVAVRTALLRHLEATGRDEAAAGDEAFARRQVKAAQALQEAQDKAQMRVARLVGRHVHASPGMTPGAARKKLSGRDKPRFAEALELAVDMAWVVETDGTLQPGASRPSDE